MSIFRLGDQRPPEPQRINDTVVMRFEHVYEIDPALMELTGQQELPAWDTRRIVDARWDHLDWMHEHFADEVLLADEGSETMPEGEDAEPEPHAMPSEEEAGPRPVPGSLEDPPT
jgi:hypothetical protein